MIVGNDRQSLKHERGQLKMYERKTQGEDGGGIGRVITFSFTNSLKEQQNG